MTKYKVTTPAPNHLGFVGGVAFANGQAVVDSDTHPAEMRYFRQAGYSVEAVDEPEPSAVQVGATGSEPYDPATHDMPNVLAYLDGAGEVEARRVLEAEAAGKNRKGILDQAEAIIARERALDEKTKEASR